MRVKKDTAYFVAGSVITSLVIGHGIDLIRLGFKTPTGFYCVDGDAIDTHAQFSPAYSSEKPDSITAALAECGSRYPALLTRQINATFLAGSGIIAVRKATRSSMLSAILTVGLSTYRAAQLMMIPFYGDRHQASLAVDSIWDGSESLVTKTHWAAVTTLAQAIRDGCWRDSDIKRLAYELVPDAPTSPKDTPVFNLRPPNNEDWDDLWRAYKLSLN